jgi:hypothetical protein
MTTATAGNWSDVCCWHVPQVTQAEMESGPLKWTAQGNATSATLAQPLVLERAVSVTPILKPALQVEIIEQECVKPTKPGVNQACCVQTVGMVVWCCLSKPAVCQHGPFLC